MEPYLQICRATSCDLAMALLWMVWRVFLWRQTSDQIGVNLYSLIQYNYSGIKAGSGGRQITLHMHTTSQKLPVFTLKNQTKDLLSLPVASSNRQFTSNLMLQNRCINMRNFLFLLALLTQTLGLHLHQRTLHLLITTTDLKNKASAALKGVTDLNASLNATLTTLNPFNQEDRLSKMELTINNARTNLINIYSQSVIPLNGSEYYCQQLTPQQLASLNTALTNIEHSVSNMSSLPPLSDSSHPNQQTSKQIKETVQSIRKALSQGGIQTAAAPIPIYQSNLVAKPDWVLGNSTLSQVASGYQVGKYQNGETCPVEKPFVDNKNTCIDCSEGYYNYQTKNCQKCANFDKQKHVCISGVTNLNATNQTTNPTNQTTTPTNQTTNPINPVTPLQRITNTQNTTSLLLPTNTTLDQYRGELSKQGTNLSPCPPETPFYDGTKCISCPQGQLFSTLINTCQTCPESTVYSNISLHCEPIAYYTALGTSDQWISVQKTVAQLQQQQKINASIKNAKPCPKDSPFFDGNKCISCASPTPLFSFDSGKCSSCLNGSIFSPNIHSCVFSQQRQTNLNSPNLILDGHPFNEWKSYYVNNQTANPQLGDCPQHKPYFDGLTCVSCSAPNNYFSLERKVCTHCAEGTAYDSNVRQCLSSSGNIVAQSPTLAKMAAGIFA